MDPQNEAKKHKQKQTPKRIKAPSQSAKRGALMALLHSAVVLLLTTATKSFVSVTFEKNPSYLLNGTVLEFQMHEILDLSRAKNPQLHLPPGMIKFGVDTKTSSMNLSPLVIRSVEFSSRVSTSEVGLLYNNNSLALVRTSVSGLYLKSYRVVDLVNNDTQDKVVTVNCDHFYPLADSILVASCYGTLSRQMMVPESSTQNSTNVTVVLNFFQLISVEVSADAPKVIQVRNITWTDDDPEILNFDKLSRIVDLYGQSTLIVYDYGQHITQSNQTGAASLLPQFLATNLTYFSAKYNSDTFQLGEIKVHNFEMPDNVYSVQRVQYFGNLALSVVYNTGDVGLVQAELNRESNDLSIPDFNNAYNSSTGDSLFEISPKNSSLLEYLVNSKSLKLCKFKGLKISNQNWLQNCTSILGIPNVEDGFIPLEIATNFRAILVYITDLIDFKIYKFFTIPKRYSQVIEEKSDHGILLLQGYIRINTTEIYASPMKSQGLLIEVSELQDDNSTLVCMDDDNQVELDFKVNTIPFLGNGTIQPFPDLIVPSGGFVSFENNDAYTIANTKEIRVALKPIGNASSSSTAGQKEKDTEIDFEVASYNYLKEQSYTWLAGFPQMMFSAGDSICGYDGNNKLKTFSNCSIDPQTRNIRCTRDFDHLFSVGKGKLLSCLSGTLNGKHILMAFFQPEGIKRYSLIKAVYGRSRKMNGKYYGVIQNETLQGTLKTIRCIKKFMVCFLLELRLINNEMLGYRTTRSINSFELGITERLCPVGKFNHIAYPSRISIMSSCSPEEMIVYTTDLNNLNNVEMIYSVDQDQAGEVYLKGMSTSQFNVLWGAGDNIRVTFQNYIYSDHIFPAKQLGLVTIKDIISTNKHSFVLVGQKANQTNGYTVQVFGSGFSDMRNFLALEFETELFSSLQVSSFEDVDSSLIVMMITVGKTVRFYSFKMQRPQITLKNIAKTPKYSEAVLETTLTTYNGTNITNSSKVYTMPVKETISAKPLSTTKRDLIVNKTYLMSELVNVSGYVDSLSPVVQAEYEYSINFVKRIMKTPLYPSPSKKCLFIAYNNGIKLCVVESSHTTFTYYLLRPRSENVSLWEPFVEHNPKLNQALAQNTVTNVEVLYLNGLTYLFTFAKITNKKSDCQDSCRLMYLRTLDPSFKLTKRIDAMELKGMTENLCFFVGANNRIHMFTSSFEYIYSIHTLIKDKITVNNQTTPYVGNTDIFASYILYQGTVNILVYSRSQNKLSLHQYNLATNTLASGPPTLLNRRYLVPLKGIWCRGYDEPRAGEYIGQCVMKLETDVNILATIPVNSQIQISTALLMKADYPYYVDTLTSWVYITDDYVGMVEHQAGSLSYKKKYCVWYIKPSKDSYYAFSEYFYEDEISQRSFLKNILFSENGTSYIYRGLDLTDNVQFLSLQEASISIKDSSVVDAPGRMTLEYNQYRRGQSVIDISELFVKVSNKSSKPSGSDSGVGKQGATWVIWALLAFFLVSMLAVFIAAKALEFREKGGFYKRAQTEKESGYGFADTTDNESGMRF